MDLGLVQVHKAELVVLVPNVHDDLALAEALVHGMEGNQKRS